MAARREFILMQSMFAAKNFRGQRDRLLEFKIKLQQTAGDPIEEVSVEVCISNRFLQSQLQLQHTPGDPLEDLLPSLSLDEMWLHDSKVRPPHQTPGDPIEEVISRLDKLRVEEAGEVFMRDSILHFQLQLQQPPEGPIEEVVSGLAEVCFHGLEAAAGYLNLGLRNRSRAAENGARLAPNPSFSDEQKLFEELAAAQRLPARPTTLAEALSRVQATLYAVKLPQEHLLPRCTGHLSPTDPAAGSSMDDARTTLEDAYILLNLAIKHIDLAVAAISPFVHPNEVAINSRFAESYTTFGWDEQRVTINRSRLNLVTSKGRGGAAAAGRMSEKTLVSIIVMQSMFAGKNIPAQRDRLLQFQLQLQQTPGEPTEEVVSGLAKVRLAGLKYAAHYLTICLDKAAETGACLAPNPSFSDFNQLFDALEAAKRLPARPTTHAEAFSRIQAALYAVKLTQEHLLQLGIGHLSPTDPAPDATGVPPRAAGSRMNDARICLGGSCTILNVAVKHIDLAVAFMSTFVHPNELASYSRFADRYADFGWGASLSLLNLLHLV